MELALVVGGVAVAVPVQGRLPVVVEVGAVDVSDSVTWRERVREGEPYWEMVMKSAPWDESTRPS